MIAYVVRADDLIPGLFNVATEDGRHFFDITTGQLRDLAEREGWDIRTQPDRRDSE